MELVDNSHKAKDKLRIYSLLHKATKPLYAIDFLFREVDSKLEWMLFSGNLRSGCFIGKDDLSPFEDFTDFIEYRKEFLSKVGLIYPYEIKVTNPKLNIGEYYPNIYRPEFSSKLQQSHFVHDGCPFLEENFDPHIDNYEEYSDYVRQLDIILTEFNNVFKVIAPSKENFNNFGNLIRNIIVLACTEIDSLMHNVLVRNGYCKADAFTSMNDYRILNEAMRLNEYSISFSDYFHLGEFFPFKEWTTKGGTLSWYNAYNHVKHKRYENFAEANLENAINAVMGLAVFLVAQYGSNNNLWKRKIDTNLKIRKRPYWAVEDYYIPFTNDIAPVAVQYPFPKKVEQTQTRLKYKEVGNLLKNKAPKAKILDSIDELRNRVESEYKE